MSINKTFGRMARWTSKSAGSPTAAGTAITLIFIWALSGPIFHFSDDWQLVINTGTTIVTFLMVFFIQYSQNCDSVSVHIKLDELIRSNELSDNKLMDLDGLDHCDLEKLRDALSKMMITAEVSREVTSQEAAPGISTPQSQSEIAMPTCGTAC